MVERNLDHLRRRTRCWVSSSETVCDATMVSTIAVYFPRLEQSSHARTDIHMFSPDRAGNRHGSNRLGPCWWDTCSRPASSSAVRRFVADVPPRRSSAGNMQQCLSRGDIGQKLLAGQSHPSLGSAKPRFPAKHFLLCSSRGLGRQCC